MLGFGVSMPEGEVLENTQMETNQNRPDESQGEAKQAI